MFAGKDNDIRVALHAACHYKAKETVYFLLEKGADPNVVGQYLVHFSNYHHSEPFYYNDTASQCKCTSNILPSHSVQLTDLQLTCLSH